MNTLQPLDHASNLADIYHQLQQRGVAMLRGFAPSLEDFSRLMNGLCHNIIFDPARQHMSDNTQKVDAGTDAVGLHTENGHTPLPPDIVAFYSRKSASRGSRTTWCDGVALYQALPERLQRQFLREVVVSRIVPKPMWQSYVATALELPNAQQVTKEHLNQLLAKLDGQWAEFDTDDNCRYHLTINPIRPVGQTGQLAFANALLGPSFNYEKPEYHYRDGTAVSLADLQEVSQIAEQCTSEVNWQDGDIIVLDNQRIMHGRRAIEVPLTERELFIGMGNSLKDTDGRSDK